MCLSGWYIWFGIQTRIWFMCLSNFCSSQVPPSFLPCFLEIYLLKKQETRNLLLSVSLMSSVVVRKYQNLIDVARMNGWRSEGPNSSAWYLAWVDFHFLPTFVHCPSLEQYPLDQSLSLLVCKVELLIPAFCSISWGGCDKGWDFKNKA